LTSVIDKAPSSRVALRCSTTSKKEQITVTTLSAKAISYARSYRTDRIALTSEMAVHMANFDWKYKSVGELAAALAAREISALELADAAIARVESLDPKLNAVCVRDFDRARDAARAADDALATGDRRPLLGIPLLVK
jgi:hypothetical protein